MAIWSTDPVLVAEHPATDNHSLDLTVDGPDGPVRVIGVHPPTPIMNFDAGGAIWPAFGELGPGGDTPTVIVGDFNAVVLAPGLPLHCSTTDTPMPTSPPDEACRPHGRPTGGTRRSSGSTTR